MNALRDPLTRAWLALVLLSGLATLLSTRAGHAAGAAILAVAAIKARLILTRYLGLAEVPAWRRAFDLLLGCLVALLLVLYLAA